MRKGVLRQRLVIVPRMWIGGGNGWSRVIVSGVVLNARLVRMIVALAFDHAYAHGNSESG